MKIKFDTAIAEKLGGLLADQSANLVLDFDHTLSRENNGLDCCGISRYRLVLIDKETLPDVFDMEIESSFGPIYFKKWASFYLEENMTIRQKNNLIEFLGDGGQIAPHMEIVDFRNKKLAV